jgi:ABC-type multidrug transport system ATPase subunit
LLEIINLTKKFGGIRVFSRIDFSCNKPQIILLSGENGVGKTTLLRCIAGLEKNYSGQIILEHPHSVSFFGEKHFLYPHLTVFENLYLYASLFKIPIERVQSLLVDFNLLNKKNELTKNLSQGKRARVGLCRVLLQAPKLLLLDEPSAHLDESSFLILIAKIKDLCRDTLVIVASHDIERFKVVAQSTITLVNGSLEYKQVS